MSSKLPVGLSAGASRAEAGRAPVRTSGLARLRFMPAAGVIGSVAADAQRSRLPQMAAALAYRTIFGIIPVLVVALVGLKFFTTEEDIQHTLEQALRYAGLSEIVVDAEDTKLPAGAGGEQMVLVPFGPFLVPHSTATIDGSTGASDGDAAGESPEEGAAAEPARTDSTGSPGLDKWITQLVGRVSAIPFRTIGVIGLAALLYAAISMLVEIERSFNQIYRVPVGRSWARRVTNYWTLLTLGVLMLFATFYVGEQFKNWATELAQSRQLEQISQLPPGSGPVQVADKNSGLGTVGFVLTVFISTAFLLLAYTSVPNTRVRLRPALAGAFTAAVLWETGKWGFTLYLDYSAGYARMYGSFAILPLFLLWVYVTWVIVLLGLQISYYIQFEQYKVQPVAAEPARPKPPAILDPAASVAVVAAIARAFQEGRAATVAGLAGTVRAGEDVVRAIVERLAARQIIHSVERDPAQADAAEGFMLSRPAEAIPMTEVLEAGYELVSGGAGDAGGGEGAEGGAGRSGDGVDPMVERLRKAQVAAVAGMTVAELVQRRAAGGSAGGAAKGEGAGQNGAGQKGAGYTKPVAPATLPTTG